MTFAPDPVPGCTHLDAVRTVLPQSIRCGVCGDDAGGLARQICMSCGHVGCGPNSPRRHAHQHFLRTGHPIVRSAEPGDRWGWCFLDDQPLLEPPLPPNGQDSP